MNVCISEANLITIILIAAIAGCIIGLGLSSLFKGDGEYVS